MTQKLRYIMIFALVSLYSSVVQAQNDGPEADTATESSFYEHEVQRLERLRGTDRYDGPGGILDQYGFQTVFHLLAAHPENRRAIVRYCVRPRETRRRDGTATGRTICSRHRYGLRRGRILYIPREMYEAHMARVAGTVQDPSAEPNRGRIVSVELPPQPPDPATAGADDGIVQRIAYATEVNNLRGELGRVQTRIQGQDTRISALAEQLESRGRRISRLERQLEEATDDQGGVQDSEPAMVLAGFQVDNGHITLFVLGSLIILGFLGMLDQSGKRDIKRVNECLDLVTANTLLRTRLETSAEALAGESGQRTSLTEEKLALAGNLAKAEIANETARAELAEKQDEARRNRDEAGRQITRNNELAGERNDALEEADDLAAVLEVVLARESGVAEQEAGVAEREASCDRREAGVAEREVSCDRREAAHAKFKESLRSGKVKTDLRPVHEQAAGDRWSTNPPSQIPPRPRVETLAGFSLDAIHRSVPRLEELAAEEDSGTRELEAPEADPPAQDAEARPPRRPTQGYEELRLSFAPDPETSGLYVCPDCSKSGLTPEEASWHTCDDESDDAEIPGEVTRTEAKNPFLVSKPGDADPNDEASDGTDT